MLAQVAIIALAFGRPAGLAARTPTPTPSMRAMLKQQGGARIMPQVRYSHYRELPPPIPPDFTYRGKPIEAACLEALTEDDARDLAPRRVLLENCPTPPNILDCDLSRNHDDDPWWDLRGYRGYCFKAMKAGVGGSHELQHNVVYKYLGRWHGHNALLVESGKGTSSSATERRVLLVDVEARPPAMVLAGTLATGTLTPIDARVAGVNLFYTAGVQGIQFAELAGLNLPRNISPIDFPESGMLADSDMAEFEDGQVKSVRLFPYAGTRQEVPAGTNPHLLRRKCFLQTHQKYVDAKRIELSPSGLRLFLQEVIACMEAVH